MNLIPIIIPIYDRIENCRILIDSIKRQSVTLLNFKFYFFVDYSVDQISVIEYLKKININSIQIISRPNKFGLKKNIIESVNETFKITKSPFAVLLEDDLLLSKYCFEFIEQVSKIKRIDNIFGISLYAQLKNEWNGYFLSFTNNQSFFGCTLPSSWGSIIYNDKWNAFTQTLDDNLSYNLNGNRPEIPRQLEAWNTASSWKKELSKYCTDNQLYYLYPKVSLTAHIGNIGTNMKGQNNAHQNTSLATETMIINQENFESLEFYDLFFEPQPHSFKEFVPSNVLEKLEIDLWGSKKNIDFDKYYLTSKKCTNPIQSWDLKFSNPRSNIIPDNTGNFFHLCRGQDIIQKGNNFSYFFEAHFGPHYKRNLTRYLMREFFNKIKGLWRD